MKEKRAIFIKTGQNAVCYDAEKRKEPSDMSDTEITKRLLSYIEDNLDKELTLEKIAKDLNYSRFYMARIFKENTETTIYKYIQGRRLSEAAGKLAGTGRPIVEIALEAGYGSQQAFTTAFRRRYLCTPQEYRERGKLCLVEKQTKHIWPERDSFCRWMGGGMTA